MHKSSKGFSPWGFGPAYIVHDWIFYAQHCYVDRDQADKPLYEDGKRFADVYKSADYQMIDFNESAEVLAEVIKTIVDNGEVKPENVPATLISAAVDSMFAQALWNEEGACDAQRVEPLDIAILWVRLNKGHGDVPATWKLSPAEIKEARALIPKALALQRSLTPDPPSAVALKQ